MSRLALSPPFFNYASDKPVDNSRNSDLLSDIHSRQWVVATGSFSIYLDTNISLKSHFIKRHRTSSATHCYVFIILRMQHILTVSPGCASSYFTHAWRYTPIVKDRILSVINLQHAYLQIRRCSLKRDTLEIAWSRWKLSRCSLQYKSRYTQLWKLLVRMAHEIYSTLLDGSIAPQAWLTQP